MIPYAVAEGFVGQNDLESLAIVRRLLDKLPDPPDDAPDFVPTIHHGRRTFRGWSCHGLARCAAVRLNSQGQSGWLVLDGYFGRIGAEHSWLWRNGVLLDVYPVAGASGPILADGKRDSPWRVIYIESSTAYDESQLAMFRDEAAYAAGFISP